jgi:hypothetical protein
MIVMDATPEELTSIGPALASTDCHAIRCGFSIGGKVNRKEIEHRIWGKSIATARKTGLISEHEAQCLIEEYLRDFRSKNGWDGKTYISRGSANQRNG